MMPIILPQLAVTHLEAMSHHPVRRMPPHSAFDDITCLAAHICCTSSALIVLIEPDCQHIQSALGWDSQTFALDPVFCTTVMKQRSLVVIPDTLADTQFAASPTVLTSPRIRFYAGAPLIDVEGNVLGILCVLGQSPSNLSTEQCQALQALSRQAVALLVLQRSVEQGEQIIEEHQWAITKLSRLAAIFESSEDAILSITPDGRITRWNPGAERLYGYSSQEAIGQSILLLVLPSCQDELAAILEKLWCGETTPGYETVGLHKEGLCFDIFLSSFPILDATGAISDAAVIVRDITKRKQTEQALRTQTEILQSILDSMGDGVAVADEEGAFLLFNPAAEQILRLGSIDTGPEQWTAAYGLFLPDKTTPYPTNELPLVRALHGEAVDQAEMFVRNEHLPGGIWLSVTARPLHAEGGTIRGSVAVFRDISMHKQTKEVLYQYAERLKILRQIDLAILSAQSLEAIAQSTLRHICQLLPCEQAGMVLFDFEAQVCIPLATLFHSEEPRWISGERFALKSFGKQALEALRQGKINHIADLRSHPLRSQKVHVLQAEYLRSYLEVPLVYQGEAIGLLCLGAPAPGIFTPDHVAVVREAADQMAVAIQQARLHEQIRQHSTALEQRVVERTGQLEQAVQELEAFSYSVSHDLRAPLRAIKGFARTLIEEYASALPDEAQTYLRHVLENTRQMDQLIDDLLAFSRLERQELRKQPVSPLVPIQESLSDLTAEQSGREVQITLGNLPVCQADRSLLKQVFVNLLSNALKYTRNRAVARIEVGSLAPASPSSPPIYFVKDNGVGFDMRYAQKLFGVFQRLHRAEDFEGTGVGLAIAKRILQRHGGHIWAEAEVDKGATFYFTIEKDSKL